MALESAILIRHAESEHHIRKLSGGWTDTPITERGHQQAHLVAQRLKRELGDLPVRLYTSDLLRTRNTAQHIAEAFNVEPIADERLREFNNGEAAGLTAAEAQQRWPDAPRPWHVDHRQWPAGETWREFHERAGQFIDELDCSGPLPIVVTHGGTHDTMVARWLRLEVERVSTTGFAAHVTCVTVLQKDELGHRRVERLNDISHLAGTHGYITLGATVAQS